MSDLDPDLDLEQLEQRLRAAAGPLTGGALEAPTDLSPVLDPVPLPDLGPILEATGHADVVYTIESSPLGDLLLAATPRGLVCVHYVREESDVAAELERIAARLTPRIVAAGRGGGARGGGARGGGARGGGARGGGGRSGGWGGGRLERPRRELDEYFSGARRTFEIPLDWGLVKPGFTRSVLRETAAIPFGQTLSYAGIAGRAGNERAYRAAGTALGSNPLPIVIPCHRVLHSGGGLGGYTGGLDVKRELLRIEGVL